MQFLQPIWLWGLLGVWVPVAIHLWNIRPGRVVKVGSIALFERSKGQSARSLKLKELLLLAIRCLLITFLSLLLARPVIPLSAKGNEKPWMVISKDDLAAAKAEKRPLIDSLLSAGYELRNTDTAFTRYSLKDSSKITSENLLTGWDAVKELNEKLKAEKAVLITNNRIKNFSGKKPVINKHIDWITLENKSDTLEWLQSAYMKQDSLRLVWGRSVAGGTTFKDQSMAMAGLSDGRFTTSFDSGQLKLSWKNDPENVLIVDSVVTEIVVVAGENKSDTRYLMAALQAVAQNAEKPVNIKLQSETEEIFDPAWVFWLSSKPIPALSENTRLFRYSKNKMERVNSILITQNNISLADPVPVFMQAKETGLDPVWKDGAGNILLGRKGNEFVFASQLIPSATSLVWNQQFPELLNELITTSSIPRYDSRNISFNQSQPLKGGRSTNISLANSTQNTRAASYIVGAIMLLLLLTDRILSHRNLVFK